MMAEVIWVDGKPVPWSLIANQRGKSYKPARLRKWQNRVAQTFELNRAHDWSSVQLVRLDLVFCFVVKRGELAWKATRPDIDNLRKAVQDALSKTLPDDAVVVLGETAKIYTPARLGVLISLSRVEDIEIELDRMGLNPAFFSAKKDENNG